MNEDINYSQIFQPAVILNPENLTISPTARVDSFCKLECGEGIEIGDFCHIASFCHLNIGGGKLTLEEGSSCASGVKIITGSNIPGPNRSCSAVAPGNVIERSSVHIGKNATLFVGAIVLPGITVGDGAIIAAGAVVTRDVPAGETWAGVPARKVKDTPKNASLTSEQDLTDFLNRYSHLFTIHSDRPFVESQAELYCWDQPT